MLQPKSLAYAVLALALLLPAAGLAVNGSEPAGSASGQEDDQSSLDKAKRLTQKQGEMSEETVRAAESGVAKPAPPPAPSQGKPQSAPPPAKSGGKAIYGDIIIYK